MEAERGYAPLIITIKESGEFIGSGGVVPTKDSADIEIAYHFLPSAWGKGYATEAAVAILEFAFKTAGLEEIVGFVFSENVASWRVLEKRECDSSEWQTTLASTFPSRSMSRVAQSGFRVHRIPENASLSKVSYSLSCRRNERTKLQTEYISEERRSAVGE